MSLDELYDQYDLGCSEKYDFRFGDKVYVNKGCERNNKNDDERKL